MRAILNSARMYSGRAYLFVATRLWHRLPATAHQLRSVRLYGAHLHRTVLRFQARSQNHSTFFFRNRPELELMRRLAERLPLHSELNVSVLGCSKGAEVYSIVWTLRSARPDLVLRLHAIDISQEILDFAKEGIYFSTGTDGCNHLGIESAADGDGLASATYKHQHGMSIFDRTTEREMEGMFNVEGTRAAVQPWLKEGISWQRADVADPKLLDTVGPQDIVVANRFLCHMHPAAAERCLLGIARLVKPGGHLFVSGVDLDVRTKVAHEMAWKPVTELLQQIYEGDESLMNGWPTAYWALEPFQPARRDSTIRYASVFQLVNGWLAFERH
jgi:chemotaxis methyl-accepting protein methylase